MLRVNRKAIFANKCSGGSDSSIQTLCAMLYNPPPISKNVHSQHVKAICEQSVLQAQVSLEQAMKKVHRFYDATNDDVVDVVISCDGTGQRRGGGGGLLLHHFWGQCSSQLMKHSSTMS